MVSLGVAVHVVLRITGEFGPTQGVRVVQLLILGYGNACAKVGETQEHVSQCVVSGDGAGVAGDASLEHKAAARVADAGTDRRLKVVEVEVVVGEAVLGSVFALGPAEVDVAGELVVAEQERVCTVGVSQGRKAGKCKIGWPT